ERQLEYDLVCLQIKEGEQKKQQLQDQGRRKIEIEELQQKQLEVMQPVEVALQRSKVTYLERQLAQVRKNRDRVMELPGSTVSEQEREQQELLLAQADAECTAGRETLQQLVK